MQAEAETEEAVEEKRYNFTTLLFFPPFSSCLPLCSASRGRAHLGGGIGARGSPTGPTPARCLYQPRAQHAPRPLHFFFFFFNVPTVKNKQNLEERFLFGGAVGSK